VLGTSVDLAKVHNDMYAVGAMTDHLVPWHSAYAATQAFGGDVRYVLSNSGHIQALINPPGNPKANYFASDTTPADPEEWLKNAESTSGTWWDDWVDWMKARSGATVPAPTQLGSTRYPPLEPAPGRYVQQ
jgi:polyhydroxyalkanoate synthase